MLATYAKTIWVTYFQAFCFIQNMDHLQYHWYKCGFALFTIQIMPKNSNLFNMNKKSLYRGYF